LQNMSCLSAYAGPALASANSFRVQFTVVSSTTLQILSLEAMSGSNKIVLERDVPDCVKTPLDHNQPLMLSPLDHTSITIVALGINRISSSVERLSLLFAPSRPSSFLFSHRSK